MTRLLPVLVILCPALVAAEPFTVDHLVRIARVGSPVLSPDGETVVYTVRTTDMDADKGRYDLWVSNVDGSAPLQLTSHEANDTSPAWNNDGTQVLFLTSRSGSSQVWSIALSGGEARQVTDLPLDVGTFKLSPTGDALVVSMSVYPDCQDLECTVSRDKKTEESKVSAQTYEQIFMRHWDYWLSETQSRLFAIPLNNGKASSEATLVSRVNADVPSRVWGGSEEYSISADGQTVYFAARIRDRAEPTSTNFDIYQAPMSGDGRTVNLTESNKAWDTAPVISPDGNNLAYLAMERPGFEADKFNVVVRDLESGDSRILTSDWDRSPSSIAFSADGSKIVMNAQDVGNKTLWKLDMESGEATRVLSDTYVSAFEVGNDRIVFASDTLTSPSEIYTADLDGGNVRQITSFAEKTLKDVQMGDYEQFSFTGAGGDTVYGYLVKPVGFEKGKEYPVAFLIHGGPQGSFSNHFHYRWNPQTYAGQGFAAIMIDFHGSTGYGQDFTDSISGDWGGKPLEDLQLGLKAATDKYGFLDQDRVCALGASYGGYMINWIAGNWSDRFDCLVNHDGVFDNRSMYYTTEELWFPEWEHGGPYFEREEAFEKYNPVNYVENWQTPMLVIHGELDYRVPVTQGIGAFTALQRRGIESRFVYYPDENHWVLKPHNSIKWHQEVNAWLRRYLDE